MIQRTSIIAEAGVNHNGDINMALELVDKAAESGADYVKFQTFDAKKLATKLVSKAAYQKKTTDAQENQFDMLQKLQLTDDQHEKIITHCLKRKIKFLSSAFDQTSLNTLIKRFNQSEIKFGSGELTNAPLLLDAARSDVKIILSTGMSNLSEVEEALGVLAFGMCKDGEPLSRSDFNTTLHDPAVWQVLAERVTLLHCTTEYPSSFEDANLLAIDTMRQAFGVQVGFSDHTEGIAICLAAVALGASIIEKHFTLSRGLPGPDHKASLEPDELKQLVKDIRAVELAIGNGIKQPRKPEIPNRDIVRKSLVAAKSLDPGQILTRSDIAVKRSGKGTSPMLFWDRLGTEITQKTNKDEII